MSFSMKSAIQPVPTHVKFLSKNPDKVGIVAEITLILLNPEWRTITFFSKEFKLNVKSPSDEAYCTNRENLYKSLKRGTCIANLIDGSNIDLPKFECDVFIEAAPPSKKGRKYKFESNRITIEPSKDENEENSEEQTPHA